MICLTFITAQGESIEVHSDATTLMEAAVDHDVPGIDADCGGGCSCGTCHVHVREDWAERVGKQNESEATVLAYAVNVTSRSRLACQIELSKTLDGLVVDVPNG